MLPPFVDQGPHEVLSSHHMCYLNCAWTCPLILLHMCVMIHRQAYQQYRAGTYFVPSCQLRPAKDRRTASVASMFAICRSYSGQLHLALLCMHSISTNAIACLVPQRNGCLAKHSSAVTAFLGYSGRFLTRNLANLGCNKSANLGHSSCAHRNILGHQIAQKLTNAPAGPAYVCVIILGASVKGLATGWVGKVSCVTRPCIVGFQINNEYRP